MKVGDYCLTAENNIKNILLILVLDCPLLDGCELGWRFNRKSWDDFALNNKRALNLFFLLYLLDNILLY